jgi:hypothetical protein
MTNERKAYPSDVSDEEPAQLIVHQRKQFCRGFGIAVLNLVQKAGNVAGGMQTQHQTFVAYRNHKWTDQSLLRGEKAALELNSNGWRYA